MGTWFVAVVRPGAHRDQREASRRDLRGSDERRSDPTPGPVRAAAVRGALEMLANIAAMDS